MSEWTDHNKAFEKRMEWLKWGKAGGRTGGDTRFVNHKGDVTFENKDLPLYVHALETGDTYFMNKKFCELVDYARLTVPDNLVFDPAWMISPAGWMWIDEPFKVPKLKIQKGVTVDGAPLLEVDSNPRLHAVAWSKIPVGYGILRYGTQDLVIEGSYEVMFYMSREDEPGFNMWSYMCVLPGDEILKRLQQFETNTIGTENAVAYDDATTNMLHELRWFFTAMHLMSQKLTTTVQHRAERGTRKRMERQQVPFVPMLRVVTLRRMEEAREKDPKGKDIEWHWHWRVHGHWRLQPYPSKQDYFWIWIDDYIKGDMDKPLKPEQLTVYKAVR